MTRIAKLATICRSYRSYTIGHDMIRSNYASPLCVSPPGLSCSSSSKSSSINSSSQSEDYNVLSSYMGNFEEIGLDDDISTGADTKDYSVKFPSNYTLNPCTSKQSTFLGLRGSSASHPRNSRDLFSGKRSPSYHKSKNSVANVVDGLRLEVIPRGGKRLMNISTAPHDECLQRNHSLGLPIVNGKKNINPTLQRPKRFIWQTNRERKNTSELEKEFDEDDGADVPDDCYLENVPISPRPASQQSQNHATSSLTSPERPSKGKIKPLGNGTSAQPAEQGELRTPRLSSGRPIHTGQGSRSPSSQYKNRAMSWSAAMSDLSQEVKELTAALEELENKNGRMQRTSYLSTEKVRVKSAFAELPPLRRTDAMIDPLPISREKEAVLSRTRPSWLPPKDPAEEKRHLKEYKKMMASFMEADRKKGVSEHKKMASLDDQVKNYTQVGENHVVPNWSTSTCPKY